MEDLPEDMLGPKMLALTPLQRRFAYIMGCGATQDNAAQAARDAGYSDREEACKVRGAELRQKQYVLDAILEVGRKNLNGLAPVAIYALKQVLIDPKHPKQIETANLVLQLAGFSIKTEHKVTVEHKADLSEIEALARKFAEQYGMPVERLLGVAAKAAGNGSDARVIEHEAVVEGVDAGPQGGGADGEV